MCDKTGEEELFGLSLKLVGPISSPMQEANKERPCSAKRSRINNTKQDLASLSEVCTVQLSLSQNHESVVFCVDLPSLGELRRERHRTSSFDIALNLVSGVSTIMDYMFVIRRLSSACQH